MDEYLRMMKEYALSAYQAISLEWMVMLGLTTVIGGMVIYFNSQRYMDRAVSKRKIRARHMKVIEEADAAITGALEASHRQGKLKREEVDFIYKMIRNGCPKFKELGPEPSFGKPWYYGTTLPENAAKVKASIYSRLKASGMSIKQIWDAKRRIQNSGGKTAQQDMADLVASIKRKS